MHAEFVITEYDIGRIDWLKLLLLLLALLLLLLLLLFLQLLLCRRRIGRFDCRGRHSRHR